MAAAHLTVPRFKKKRPVAQEFSMRPRSWASQEQSGVVRSRMVCAQVLREPRGSVYVAGAGPFRKASCPLLKEQFSLPFEG